MDHQYDIIATPTSGSDRFTVEIILDGETLIAVETDGEGNLLDEQRRNGMPAWAYHVIGAIVRQVQEEGDSLGIWHMGTGRTVRAGRYTGPRWVPESEMAKLVESFVETAEANGLRDVHIQSADEPRRTGHPGYGLWLKNGTDLQCRITAKDDLGNWCVLTESGQVRQVYQDETR